MTHPKIIGVDDKQARLSWISEQPVGLTFVQDYSLF
jgi:hypothetical protein